MDWLALSRGPSLSIPDRLSVDLERLILEGSLPPGERLPSERELATLLGVSRVSIRQALHELESRGLVDRRPGRGTVVLNPGDRSQLADADFGFDITRGDELGEIMELRAIIEPPMARITALRATPRDIALLEELVLEMEQDVSNERYAELDRAFHQAIAQYTHNPHLALLNERISQQIAPSRAKRYLTKSRRTASSVSHRRIFEAIAARDGALAEHEAHEHVRVIREEIVRATDQSTAEMEYIS
ncbi:FadR/GntR family transcriptional regulator [Leucobacter sp. W1153]|uniref:FadR/GntR family transcriptional regulator n=1 Tax=Leucobacter sp. W1153 TaxID=3439064 RepID=UPI003F37F86A